MRRVAASWPEISCLLGNIVAEMGPPCGAGPPCGKCQAEDAMVIIGTSPDGRAVRVKVTPEGVMEVEGCEDLVDEIRRRPCAVFTGGKTQ